MDQQKYQLELIDRARRGDRQSLEELAALAHERLRTYVYRMTQEDNLAQEIVQETLFEMCKALGKLKSNDRFWPWLHGIATNKLRRFYRTERTQRNLAVASIKQRESMTDREDGLENLVSEELKGIVSAAIKRLRMRHKAVLIMRCYDGMSHSEIAESLGCSEFSTRMLFLRAKRALQRELSRNGFGKGSLLTALVLFGKMTAPNEAAAAKISVTTAATKVGLLAEVAVLATTKTALVSVAAAGAITAGTIVAPPILPRHDALPLGPGAPVVAQFGIHSDANERLLYHLPEGPGGPVMLRAQSGPAGGEPARLILQDANGNYDYHDGVVNINNHRLWAADLSVPTLPTDNPETIKFLRKVVPGTGAFEHDTRARGKGLVAAASRNQGQTSQPWAFRHYNVQQEDYFQADWPTTARLSDNRDEMHKRGWTYFRIRGRINGRDVFGAGRLPFVAATSRENSPWLKLRVGSLTIVDTYSQAGILEASSAEPIAYRGGSFFKGLARPWMGFHTIDTVRRDAAEKRIWFETRYLPDDRFAEVEMDCDGVKVTYTIDLETDVVDEITFTTDQGEAGNLKFEYLESIEGAGLEFSRPVTPRSRTAPEANPGLLWLVQLVEGSFE